MMSEDVARVPPVPPAPEPVTQAPLAPPAPLPVAPAAPPDPVAGMPLPRARNVRVSWRRGRLVVRAGPVGLLSSALEGYGLGVLILALVFSLAAGVAAANLIAPRPPAINFGIVLLVVMTLVVFASVDILRRGLSRHVFVFSRQALRASSIHWPGGRRRRHPPVWREDVSDVRTGDVNHPHSDDAELHVYLRDGERVGFMAGQPQRELRWVAWHLSQALGRLPPLEKPAWARGPQLPAGETPVLPYAREVSSGEVSIHTFPDGGVVVRLPRDPWASLIPYFVTIVFLGGVATTLVRPRPSFGPASGWVLLLVSAGIILLLARVGVAVTRWRHPLVVGVDAVRAYLDDPDRLSRRREWPLASVSDVRLTTDHSDGGRAGAPRYVEVVFTGKLPLRLCESRGEWDRKRVAAVLRRAAGLPGPPPEHVKRRGKRHG